jgi:hypothetical protein
MFSKNSALLQLCSWPSLSPPTFYTVDILLSKVPNFEGGLEIYLTFKQAFRKEKKKYYFCSDFP